MAVYRAEVVRVAEITPRMLRITLGGESLRGYVHTGHFDEHCRLFFPGPDGTLPELGDDDAHSPMARIYTIRRYDPATAEIDIDFFLHEGGLATPWARSARPGTPIALTDSHGHDVVPPDTQWRLFVGDSTALPAIGRALEALRPGDHATVVAIVPADEERQTFASRGAVEIRSIVASAPDEIAAAALDAVTQFPRPATPGYVWIACEMLAARKARRFLRAEGFQPGRFSATGYWRQSSEEWTRRYLALQGALEASVATAREATKDNESFLDEVDRIYSEAGL
ncbi:MAG: siderophore-interacting protein [Bauldia sp.]|nr:siderophore-interacting protein [Bauldia sp.]